MECKKQIKKTVFSHFAECNGHDTRQSDDLRTCLGTCFTKCKGHCTRQTSQICRVPRVRHSAKVVCLPSVLTEHSANMPPLPSVLPVALGTVATFAECPEPTTLGKAVTFAECLTLTLGKAAVMAALANEDMTSIHMTMRGEPYGDQGDQRGCPNREGGPKLIRFESPRWRPKSSSMIHLSGSRTSLP